MRRNGNEGKRVLTLFLCWVLCAANVIPTEMTVWASESSEQNEPSAEGEMTADRGAQDSLEESAPSEEREGEEDGDAQQPSNPEEPVTPEISEDPENPENPETPENPEDPENSENPENPEIPENPAEEDGDAQQPEEETEAPEETPEEAETEDASVMEDDAERNSLMSVMPLSVPADAIAHGEYKENGSDTVWYIEKSGKLVVEGTGEYMRPEYPEENELRLPPWYDYRDRIEAAEIRVTGMTDAGCMFYDCDVLRKVDLSKFDTSMLRNTKNMFRFCIKLTDLDVSHFDTSNITIMGGMFEECRQLTSLDVSGFNTSNVTDMSNLFGFCKNLTSLDVSRFNTSKVTNMAYMFSACDHLTSLDVSSFDTSKVTNMAAMFEQCESLTNLDISNFDTSQVTDMNRMFCFLESMERLDLHTLNTANVTSMAEMLLGCDKMKALDVSGFNTAKVTNMKGMFAGCDVLPGLDLSSFDTSRVTDMEQMFISCDALSTLDLSGFDVGNVTNMKWFLSRSANSHQNLKVIYTPRNLKISVPLEHNKNTSSDVQESETWYMADGTAIQELPKNLDYSVVITREKPASPITASITASKKKTAYQCGDTLNVDDITVLYHDSKGAIRTITQGFTTNASEITMSTPGKKTLIVSYTEPETNKVLTAEIELTVTLAMSGDSVEVTLPEAVTYSYHGRAQTPIPVVKLKNGGETLTAGTDYTVSYKNHINAGEASVIVTGMGVYSGQVEKNFTIKQAEVTIQVEDTTIAVGDAVPETFACEMTGFYNGDEEKVTGITFSYTDQEGNAVTVSTEKTGTYTVTPTAANVGANYKVAKNGYLSGTLTVAEERVVYKVVFEMMGHGSPIAPLTSVRSGQLINEPAAPTAEGFVFEGWYKDRACTKVWNFAGDTVQENITLYARWRGKTAEGGIFIQEIPDQTYTGNAIKPVPAVFAADGTLLKSGRDYTVKYGNNTNADQKEAVGGVSGSLETDGQVQNTFDKDLPYVEIKGKGNHTGTVYRNFHIRKTDIGDGRGNAAAGVTLKYTDQFVTNKNKEQKPFSSLKYKKTMKAGTDFTVTLTASVVYDADGNTVRGENGGAWSAAGTTDSRNRYTLPGIPKGYSGVFEMILTGTGNYQGEIRKTVYVTNADSLIKNVSVTVGRNQKNRPYDEGRAVRLTPGYYDGKSRKYYTVNAQGEWDSGSPLPNGNDLFTVKKGNTYLLFGRDYTVTYENNKAVGTATMTVIGIGAYQGSKSVTFKITGAAFKANTIDVKAYDQSSLNENDFRANMPYTGYAVTQNKVTLTTKKTTANPEAKTLVYGRHYTISYKNNIKKGTATMTFTAKPESGYSGKFNKTFKIGVVSLADSNSVKVEAVSGQYSLSNAGTDNKGVTTYGLTGTVPYTREGAKPSGHIRLSLIDGTGIPTGVVLKEGTDYTVSYANNTVLASADQANRIPTMTFKGKGNYTGSLKVTFSISEAVMEQGVANLSVSAASVAFDGRKKDDYEYTPKITVKDGKKTLGNKTDYQVQYKNCSQTAVKNYLEKLAALPSSANAVNNGASGWETLQQVAPRAVINAVGGKGYKTATGKEITVYLNVYQTKLTGSNLYVVVSEETAQITYNGQQMKPDVTVYFGDTKAVKAAKQAKVTDETQLTGSTYGLKKLTEKKEAAGDYILSYGVNVAAGRNKGSVTVTGTGLYGGNVTVKFTILNRDVYRAP